MSCQGLCASQAELCGAGLQTSTARLGFGSECWFLNGVAQPLTILLLAFIASLVTQHLPQTVPAIRNRFEGTWQQRRNGVAEQLEAEQLRVTGAHTRRSIDTPSYQQVWLGQCASSVQPVRSLQGTAELLGAHGRQPSSLHSPTLAGSRVATCTV